MSLDRVKTTVLEEARTKAGKRIEAVRAEAERLLADGRAADERVGADAVRETRQRLERETARELERIQHDNRLQILAAKNKAIDEVFKRVREKLDSLSDADYLELVGSWLDELPSDVGGTLRVNPRDEAKFRTGLESLNRGRSGNGVFAGVVADARVSGGAVVDGPDYNIDCTIGRRLGELRETSAGDLARVLFGA